jgi:hypothetical protein
VLLIDGVLYVGYGFNNNMLGNEQNLSILNKVISIGISLSYMIDPWNHCFPMKSLQMLWESSFVF